MNADISDCVSLVCYGNLILNKQISRPSMIEYFKSIDLHFKWYKSTKFLNYCDWRTRVFHSLVAITTPSQWIQNLEYRGAKRLWLVMEKSRNELPQHIQTAFANSDTFGIQIEFADRMEIWVPRTKVNTREIRKPKIYFRLLGTDLQQSRIKSIATDEASETLKIMLSKARNFAKLNSFDNWFQIFDEACKLIEERKVDSSVASRMLPPDGYSERSTVLIAAANRAWVFGGMGSWNDIFITEKSKQKEYDDLTGNLFNAVCDSILAATNSIGEEA